ncbi:MAG TPA: carboxypeptidase-like regulatory domain-containing protein [Pyrinomonadaceae bacterium]|jgi:hypothetical protein
MSESLPIAKETPTNPKEASQSPKVLMATAIMTAITTIGVSFIGIVPQLRGGDTKEITKLKEENNDLRKRAESAVVVPAAQDKKLNIHGTVMSEDGRRVLGGVEVYLLPEGNNLLTAKTDDEGIFDFKGIPAGTYSMILRDSTQGKSGRGLLDEANNELQVRWLGAKVKYHIKQGL